MLVKQCCGRLRPKETLVAETKFASRNLLPGKQKCSLNLFRNISLPRQTFPRLRAEETFRETTFSQKGFNRQCCDVKGQRYSEC